MGMSAAVGRGLAGALAFVAASPALAEVYEVSDRGFVVREMADVPASADEVWALLVRPSQWWDSQHTFSGDAANLSLDERAGGCWCEVLRNPVSPNAAPRGGVEHMRVVYIERDRALRLSGALGPLQADAVTGTLTFQIKTGEQGTRVLMEYVVGGYMRAAPGKIAPSVDEVLGEQLSRLAGKLGGKRVVLPAADAPPPAGETPPAEGELAEPPLPGDGVAPKIVPVDPDAGAEDAFKPEPIVGR